MSTLGSQSFLPSGAIPSPPYVPPSSRTSPSTSILQSTAMRADSYYSSQIQSPRNHSLSPAKQPKAFSIQPHSNHSPSQKAPMSPPRTRSASTEESNEALIEDWRSYTEKLRGQHEGERAHMVADRERLEEVMAEERSLWDQERNILKARISLLEQAVENRGRVLSVRGSRDTSMNRIVPGITPRQSIQQQAMTFTSPGSNAVSAASSVDVMLARGVVPQESGRNADGSPFYAPAPRNPSRTFSSSSAGSDALRVDDITAPRESVIRVTSKELKSSDFGMQSPPTYALNTIPETEPEKAAISESIDISLIQPELEGVSIKASAVSPTFVAKVLSPQFSPTKLSPEHNGSPSSSRSVSDEGRENGKGKLDVSAVMNHPVDRRLTMHAGHTPNHSISKLDFVESGGTTPTQERPDIRSNLVFTNDHYEHVHRPSIAHFDGAGEDKGYGDLEDEDKELSGQLGLTNERDKDDIFLDQLMEKLNEAKKSEGVSPSDSISSRSDDGKRRNRVRLPMTDGENEKETDDLPPLRLKASTNFGRPLGSM